MAPHVLTHRLIARGNNGASAEAVRDALRA
jgi:hypothetical protein